MLDGQQRLTAFNIGLRGSMAIQLPYRWWASAGAFPERVLALDLLAPPNPVEEGSRYTLEFVNENRIGPWDTHLWFRVADIMKINTGPDMLDWLSDKDLDSQQQRLAFRTLDRLYQAIRVDPVVAYYEEKSQDIERVLNIFIRCNNGGTPLSYSNLLLSIAVSQWDTKGAPRDFETSDHYLSDREIIKGWLTRSILKESGIWGSGLDTLPTALREVIRVSGRSEFPAGELRRVMAQRGKTLDFVDEEIEDLADMKLGDRRIFPLLTMLFPYFESWDGSDIDHVFPKSRFTPSRLTATGVDIEQGETYRDLCDRLANLQLLDRSINNEKRAT